MEVERHVEGLEAAIRSNGSFRGETKVLYWFYSIICTVQLTESLG